MLQADRVAEQLALTQASYVTIRLMQELEALESRDPNPWIEKLSLTCTGFGGCKVAPKFKSQGASAIVDGSA